VNRRERGRYLERKAHRLRKGAKNGSERKEVIGQQMRNSSINWSVGAWEEVGRKGRELEFAGEFKRRNMRCLRTGCCAPFTSSTQLYPCRDGELRPVRWPRER